MNEIALPEDESIDEAENARVFARLADMRQTLGATAFTILIETARADLEDLARHNAPWTPALTDRGLNTAMMLGLEELERSCRRILGNGPTANPGLARPAAQAGADLLRALLQP